MRARRRGRREGSALIIVMVMIMSLMIMAVVVSQDAVGRVLATTENEAAGNAFWAAEAGVGLTIMALDEAQGNLANVPSSYAFPDGSQCTISVTAYGPATNPTYVRVTSDGLVNAGTPREARRSVEVFLKPSTHPLFYKATYVGNGTSLNDRILPDYALTLGPSQPTVQGGAVYAEGTWMNRNTRVSEVDHQVDINGDGDLDDEPRLRDIYDNRVAWGWSGHVASSGSNRRLDINRDGDYGDTVTAPTVTTQPTPRDPTTDNPTPTPQSDWASEAKTDDADYIDGDVYVNGDIKIQGETNIFGDVDAAGSEDTDPNDGVSTPDGEVTGAPVTGTATNNSSYVAPPDLSDPTGDGVSTYDTIADIVVDTSNHGSTGTGFIRGEQSASTYGLLGGVGTHDNPHFHLQNGSSHTLSFGQSRDQKLILIKGNLWIHDLSSLTIDMPTGSDVQVTIVVEGNLYIADDLQYNNTNNAILFIVKGDDDNPESYVDENRNYQYDAGEQLMNDDGDGTYEGPVEGQGNVFFGDPRFGTGGVTDGYIYAQNNVYLVNPPPNVAHASGQDAIFGVYGFLSAGGIMDLGDRAGGANYNNFRVTYDPRLANGEVTFKGMPKTQGGGWQGLVVESWREVQ